MIVGSGNNNKALRADKNFISHQVIAASIAQPGKKEAYKIVPHIIKVTHAASRIILIKI
jgi:hypothetical protein